jgi:probable F420-dependent oxidoreductase
VGANRAPLQLWMPLMFEPLDQWLDIARMAEDVGIDGISLADHVAIPERFSSVHPSGRNALSAATEFVDPISAAPAMAAVTERLRFMSYVYVLPMRHPLHVAKQVGTVAGLFPGRFCFGIGAGWLTEEIELLGVDARTRGGRTDEMLDVIRQAWTDGEVEHHGRHFDIDRVGVRPAPPVPPPVWVGGKSDAALRRAVGQDGWLGMNYDLDEVQRLLGRLAELRAEAGDDRKDFEALVVPNAPMSRQLMDDLAGWGATATMVVPWVPGDPRMTELSAKRDAMERVADSLELTR